MASSKQRSRKSTTPPRSAAPASASRGAMDKLLGDHPSPPHPFGKFLVARDGKTATRVPHRALFEKDGSRAKAVKSLRTLLVQHHASPEAMIRTAQHREAIGRLGLGSEQTRLRRFPTNASTQKGNLAEVVLAEYVVAASEAEIPVYRLRFNPNVDQSMKGDDVLAFDLDVKPARIVVGEAKFRGVSSATAVKEIVDGLVRSYKGGVPASLQFVSDRLFEGGQNDLASRVLDCARQFALGELRIDYVGMLLSDTMSADRIDGATPASLRRLAMISVGVDDPDALAAACYANLE